MLKELNLIKYRLQPSSHRTRMLLGLLISWAAAIALHGENFNIVVGDTVSDGVPGVGAGRFATAKEEDFYSFTATAGQLVFFEALSQDTTFQRSLRWQLLKPSGPAVFASFFSTRGRTILPEAGEYRVRIYSGGTDPNWIGAYSFRLLAIPPDQTFPFTLGSAVSDGIPSTGAGRLEVAGAEDNYLMSAAAGQLAFFEAISQDPGLQGTLRWQVIKPSGSDVFASFFSNRGRTILPEAGEYRIRIYTDATDSDWFGPYSFRVLPIPPDQTFAYTIGNPVSDGVPEAGAGRLEAAGAEDNYVFNASAGQIAFFESLSQDAALKGSLRWQLLKPSGGSVFSSFFSNSQGRTLLPEAGQYRIRIFTDGIVPGLFGPYSFSTRGDLADQQFPIRVGDVVSDGKPAGGAGRIETPGSEDNYTFDARAGQFVIFESFQQADAFQQSLRWELTKPSGGPVFVSLFSNPQGRTLLPEAGTYKIRVFTLGDDPTWIGSYSFRTYSPVKASPDKIATLPDKPLVIPFAKLLFNDVAADTNDVLTVTLPDAIAIEGGTITLVAQGVRYNPKAGYIGTDHFTYRLLGSFGGTNETTVSVAVTPDAGMYANVVNGVRRGPDSADFCLFGDPATNYLLESSRDFTAWQQVRTLTSDSDGGMIFQLQATPGVDRLFYRARRTP